MICALSARIISFVAASTQKQIVFKMFTGQRSPAAQSCAVRSHPDCV